MQQDLFAPASTHLPRPTDAPEHASSVPIYRVQLVREAALPTTRPQFKHARAVADLLRQFLADVDREHFVAILVDRKNRLIGINTVSIGSLTGSLTHPRETFKAAILSNAAAIVIGHNHPSGSPEPSPEDRHMTQRLVQGGVILGIEVLDHVIIGDGTAYYYSFADEGLLHSYKQEQHHD